MIGDEEGDAASDWLDEAWNDLTRNVRNAVNSGKHSRNIVLAHLALLGDLGSAVMMVHRRCVMKKVMRLKIGLMRLEAGLARSGMV